MVKKIVAGLGGAVFVAAMTGMLAKGGMKKAEAKLKAETEVVAAQRAPRPVKLERVRATPIAQKREYPGVVKASAESALSFRVGGPLTSVNVKLGEPVKKGDLLMQIDPRDFEDRIQSLAAQLAGASAQLQNAEQDYLRISGLFKEKVVPQSDYDHAKNARDSAAAAVKGIQAQLAMARHALQDTSLLAPYDGTVSEQLVENHEMVRAGEVVLQFQNIQWLEATVSVPENEIVKRSMDGSKLANVSFSAISGRQFQAQLKEWSTVADPLTRTYAVTFKFQAPESFRILPGMSATVSWNDGAAKPVLTVPASAIVPIAGGGSAVWIYDEASGRAEQRSVSLGDLVGAERVMVADGLSEGERVVVSGTRLIHADLALKTTL
jgi:RND family efflux transporter MFP subunit